MAKDYLTEFLPDLEEFRQKTMQFHNKEITVPEYKGFSGGFGSYAQRGGDKHMLRLRMPGGRIDKEKLKFIVESCDKYHIDKLKLTTCQSVQIHNLDAEDLCSLIEEAWKAGMISRGGGGDFPRNVMASPLSGVQKEEYFDVQPYAKAAGEYLMGFIKAVKFPRKLKVGFSSSPVNDTHVTFRDLGFAANPNHTFDVYAAGGLGNNPKLGVCVAKEIEPEKILYYIKAMVDTFVEYGNYENRAKARTRYMQDTLGTDGFVKAYQDKLSEVMKTEKLDIVPEAYEVKKQGNGKSISGSRITPQKQDGLYAVFYQPVGGSIEPAFVKELYEAVKDMEAVELRLTPQEGMYIINCNADEAEKLLELTKDSAQTVFETSVACIGSAVCQVGLGDSQSLLNSCVEAVRRENFADGVLPKIYISGCPSSCGTHQIAALGFRGAMKQTPDGPKPAFAIFEGGNALQGREVLAETGKGMAITVTDIPKFLVELGKTVAADNTTYDEWIKTNHSVLEELVAKYTA